jgi:prevent-host-death family protein
VHKKSNRGECLTTGDHVIRRGKKTPENSTKNIFISDLRQNAGEVVKSVASTRETILITQRGRAAAVMVSMEVYENAQREMDILHLLAQGEKEMAAGIGHELDDVLKEADSYLIN